MTKLQREQAREHIRDHYQITRRITDVEIDAEIANIQRKLDQSILCDIAITLYAHLTTGAHPIVFNR